MDDIICLFFVLSFNSYFITLPKAPSCRVFIFFHMSSLSNPIISYCLTPVKLAACGLALFTTPVVNTAPLITPGHLLLGQIKHYVQCAFATYSSACNGRSRELNHHNWMMCPSNTRPVYLTPDPNRYPTLWDQGSSLIKRNRLLAS